MSMIDDMRLALRYEPKSGVFIWKVSFRGPAKKGDIAGRINSLGYRQIGFRKKLYLAHRVAWAFQNGEWPPDQIDHINRDRDDNRISNLRSVSRFENQQNRHVCKTNNSGATGVSWSAALSRWKAYITAYGTIHHLGYFDKFADAKQVRLLAEEKFFSQNTELSK